MTKKFSRRDALRSAGVSLVVIGTGAMIGCGASETALTCTDTSGLTPGEIGMRTSQEYVDASPNAEEVCSNCNFWQPAAAGACGGCQVVKGPIHPQRYCKLWAAAVS